MNVRTEKDIERLRQVALAQDAHIRRLHKEIERLSAKLVGLEFGNQAELALELTNLQKALGAAQGQPGGGGRSERRNGRSKDGQKKNTPQTGHGPTPQPALELVLEEHVLDEADLTCPECGGELGLFGDHADESELIDVIEMRFIVRKVRRRKYVCRCASCDHRETADGPTDVVIKGGRYALGFVTLVAIAKYLDHLPLERQVRQYARHGLTVTSQALFDQLFALATLLTPTYAALRQHILSQPVIGLDQTSWPLLEKRRKSWQMWALTCETAVYYHIGPHKDAATGRALLGDFQGTVVCDDFSTHNSIARDGPIRLCACGVHLRRKFVEAEKVDPEGAGPYLELFDRLWAIERRGARRAGESRAEWLARLGALRQSESAGIVAQLEAQLKNFGAGSSSKALRDAVQHARRVWPKFVVFLTDAAVWLDNNLTERSLRGPVVGRRNHFGSKSERGTQVAAVLYSLLESAKLCGLDPAQYLRIAAQRALASPATITLPHELATELAANAT